MTTVPLKAILPKPHLALPESLKFDCCATQESVSFSFDLTNTRWVWLIIVPPCSEVVHVKVYFLISHSQVATGFRWEYSEPFKISPSYGSVKPRSSCRMTATFTPTVSTSKLDSAMWPFIVYYLCVHTHTHTYTGGLSVLYNSSLSSWDRLLLF